MRTVARALAAVLFATVVASCATENAAEEADFVEPGHGGPGAGAGESFDTPLPEPKDDDVGDGSGDEGGEGGDEGGEGGEGGDGAGGDGSGGDGGGGGSCGGTENTCDGDGGELPPPPPPCDHDQDGDNDDGGDCDHDDDGDCDGDDGDGQIEGACTFTQGFWKNHPGAWPVSSLLLGANTYTSAQLIAILQTPVATDGLMILAHQLIAAKLNIAFGAPSASVSAAITAADALIGNLVIGVDTLPSSSTSGLATELDTFNNSKLADAECN